jgi:hypothetical protein
MERALDVIALRTIHLSKLKLHDSHCGSGICRDFGSTGYALTSDVLFFYLESAVRG